MEEIDKKSLCQLLRYLNENGQVPSVSVFSHRTNACKEPRRNVAASRNNRIRRLKPHEIAQAFYERSGAFRLTECSENHPNG